MKSYKSIEFHPNSEPRAFSLPMLTSTPVPASTSAMVAPLIPTSTNPKCLRNTTRRGPDDHRNGRGWHDDHEEADLTVQEVLEPTKHHFERSRPVAFGASQPHPHNKRGLETRLFDPIDHSHHLIPLHPTAPTSPVDLLKLPFKGTSGLFQRHFKGV